jgi:hypothetical protein
MGKRFKREGRRKKHDGLSKEDIGFLAKNTSFTQDHIMEFHKAG